MRHDDLEAAEQRPGGADPAAADVLEAVRPVVFYVPDDLVVRAVEGDARLDLPGVRVRDRDRDPSRIEHDAGLVDARPLDLREATEATGLPHDEVVRAVEGDARRIPGPDIDPGPVQVRTELADARCAKGPRPTTEGSRGSVVPAQAAT